MANIATYSIQQWLFAEANGKFEIDLGESGIQYAYLNELKINQNYDLNYSQDCGYYALRKQIASLYDVSIEKIIITHGAQEALYLFYRTMLNPGDHLITFSPGWQQSWEVPRAIGCDVDIIQCLPENGYQIDYDELKRKIKKNTKCIIINDPCNPTGTTLTKNQAHELIKLCEENDILLVNDEEYQTDYKNSFIHTSKQCSIVSSLSKVYGFPGLRIGWFIGSETVVEKLINYKRYTSVTNSSLCEYLGLQVLEKSSKYRKDYKKLLRKNIKLLETLFQGEPSLKLYPAKSTPFIYISMPSCLDSQEFCKSLLHNKKVLCMPGEVFLDKHAIRVSYVREESILIDGLERILEEFKVYKKLKK